MNAEASNHRSNALDRPEVEGFSSRSRESASGGGGHTGAAEARSRLARSRRTLRVRFARATRREARWGTPAH